jgi:hypothetical protein
VLTLETEYEGNISHGSLYATPQTLSYVPTPPPPHFRSRLHGVTAHRGASQGLAPLWSQVEERGESGQVEYLLKQLDPDVASIRLAAGESSRAYVRVQHRRLGYVPLELLGDGFSKALSMACNLVAASGGVMAMDEFDVSLHIGALHTIISFALEAARRLDVQLFLSTHSLDAVDALIDLASPEDDLHVLRLGRPGATPRLQNLDHTRARALREDVGLDLRRV